MERMRSVASGASQRGNITDLDRFGFSSKRSRLEYGFRAGTLTASIAAAFFTAATDDFNAAVAIFTREVTHMQPSAEFTSEFERIKADLASAKRETVEKGLYSLLNVLPDKSNDQDYAFAVAAGYYLEMIDRKLEPEGDLDGVQIGLLVQDLGKTLAASPAGIAQQKFGARIRELVAYCDGKPVTNKDRGAVRNKVAKVRESLGL